MKYPQVAVRFAFHGRPDVQGTGLLIAPGLAVAREPLGGPGYQIIHLPTGNRIGPTARRQQTAIAAALKLSESKVCWMRVKGASTRSRKRAEPQWTEAMAMLRKDRC